MVFFFFCLHSRPKADPKERKGHLESLFGSRQRRCVKSVLFCLFKNTEIEKKNTAIKFHLSIGSPCHIVDFWGIIAMYINTSVVDISFDRVTQLWVFCLTCYIIKQMFVDLLILKWYSCHRNACFNIKPVRKVVILRCKCSDYLESKDKIN